MLIRSPEQTVPLRCLQTQSEEHMASVLKIMAPEFITRGGCLRDQTITSFKEFVHGRGQLWIAQFKTDIIASLTLEKLEGDLGQWKYINNGIVAAQWRQKGSGIMDNLLVSALRAQSSTDRFVVISIVWSMFKRLGFNEISLNDLQSMDKRIGIQIAGKIRQGKKVWIGIKEGI